MSIIRRNIILNYTSSGTTILISLLLVPFYIKILGVETYGLIGFYTSLTVICNVLDFGLSPSVNRELARLSALKQKGQEMNDLLRTLEVLYWPIALLIGLIIVLISPVVAYDWLNVTGLNQVTVRQAVLLMGIAISFQWPLSLYAGGLMGLQVQHVLSIINISFAAVRGLGAVLVLWLLYPTIQMLLIWHILLNLIQTIVTALACKHYLPDGSRQARFQRSLLLQIWSFAGGMTGIAFVTAIISQADKIILSKTLDLEMFGYYSIACVITGGVFSLAAPVFYALFPKFSQLLSAAHIQELKALYYQSCQLFAVLIFPVVLTIALFSTEILYLWIREPEVVKYTQNILKFLVISTAFTLLMNLPRAYQLAHG